MAEEGGKGGDFHSSPVTFFLFFLSMCSLTIIEANFKPAHRLMNLLLSSTHVQYNTSSTHARERGGGERVF